MLNLKDQNADEIINGQQPLVEEGYYKCSLVGYKPSDYNGVTSHQIKLQIVGAPQNLLSERGKYLYVYWKEDAKNFIKSFMRAGLALGIYTEAQIKELLAVGQMDIPDFEQWVGTTCVCRISHNAYQGKTYANVADWFHVNSDTAQEARIVAGQGDDNPF